VINFKRTIVTSALPYIHGIPHLGNICGSMLPADIFHRFLNLKEEENIFICGSDTHGTPIEIAAQRAGIKPEDFANKNHIAVKKVLEGFNLDFTYYGKTNTQLNKEETYKILIGLYKNGYIIEKEESQPYCKNCKRFLADRYIEGRCPFCGGLARGDQCDDCGKLLESIDLIDPVCKLCGRRKIEIKKTKNLYLQLNKFTKKLKKWIDEKDPIPFNKKQEVLNLIKNGLVDRCITRDISWGFPVPAKDLGLNEDIYKSKVIYVWFDAPIGYISITQEYFKERGKMYLWERYWKDKNCRTIYTLGKDNTIFHSIIFPAMLIGSGENYNLPDKEMIHEYLLSEDIKFSKSRGTGLDSKKALKLLPADYWRFYLSYMLPEEQDTKFSWKDLENKINNVLNDGVGNFVNRTLTLTEKWYDNKIPNAELGGKDQKILEKAKEIIKKYIDHFENFRIKKALETALEIPRLGDKFLGDEEPWKNLERRNEVLFVCVNLIKLTAVLLWPFIPESSEKLYSMLNLKDKIILPKLDGLLFELLEAGHKLGKKEILFQKIDAKKLQEQAEK